MKTTLCLTAVAATLFITGCVGPQARHDARVDRRYAAAERTEERITDRHDNRYDRRSDRYDRRDARYGY